MITIDNNEVRDVIFTTGGHAPSTNELLYQLSLQARHHGTKLYGVEDGTQGLYKAPTVRLEDSGLFELTPEFLEPFRNISGSIQGCASGGKLPTEQEQRNFVTSMGILRPRTTFLNGGDGSAKFFRTKLMHGFKGGDQKVVLIGKTIDDDKPHSRGVAGLHSAAKGNAARIARLVGGGISLKRHHWFLVMGRDSGGLLVATAMETISLMNPDCPIPLLDFALAPEKECNPDTIRAAQQIRFKYHQQYCSALLSEGWPGFPITPPHTRTAHLKVFLSNAVSMFKRHAKLGDGTNVYGIEAAQILGGFYNKEFPHLGKKGENRIRVEAGGQDQRNPDTCEHDRKLVRQLAEYAYRLGSNGSTTSHVICSQGYSFANGSKINVFDMPMDEYFERFDEGKCRDPWLFGEHDFAERLHRVGATNGTEKPELVVEAYEDAVAEGRILPDPRSKLKRVTLTEIATRDSLVL